jgi:aromatic-L-amino-acid/L-tryptophan decarboxylase
VTAPSDRPTGDMDPEAFRRHAHDVVDWIADYLAHVGDLPVLPAVRPGEIAAQLPEHPPEHGEPMEDVLRDFREVILPGVTHWNHPGFMAYFAITGGGPGILGEMLSAALNVNAMVWRTGPAATELEERALDWLRQMVGLPAAFRGTIQDTASISTLVAVAAAREAAELGVREEGMSGRDLPRLRLYCSEEAHSSVEKAGITLGIGQAGVRRIPTDAAFRMDAAALERAVREDLAAGVRPFCAVATVGTTSTSSVDPVPAVADVCGRHGLWLHVDAAYAGPAAAVPELRHLLDGCDRADSLVLNPHKWLFVPIDCSALYTRRPEVVRRAFSLVPEYLETPEGAAATNLMDYGPALGKRFRALKLWMTLRWFGREGIADRIRAHVALAASFAARVEAAPDWELVAPAPLSLVVFRHRPRGLADAAADALNERVLERVNASGEVLLSHTRLRGRFALRLAIGNLRTTRAHVDRAWTLLREAARAEAAAPP